MNISLTKKEGGIEVTAASSHIGCVYLPFDKIRGMYRLTITFRTLSGESARFGVWEPDANVMQRFNPAESKDWQTREYFFTLNENTTTPSIGLFAQGNNQELTRVQFKNIKLASIELDRPYNEIVSELGESLAEQSKKLKEKAPKDANKYAFIFAENELVVNGTVSYKIQDPFDGETLRPVKVKSAKKMNIILDNRTPLGDCNNFDKRTREQLKISSEVKNNSIKMTALGHMPCIYFPFNYTKNAVYEVEITYKGNNPSVTIWQETPKQHIRFPVTKSNDWKTEKFQFKVDPTTETPALGLFAPGTENYLTENYYANISITEIVLAETFVVKTTQHVPIINTTMVNPTKYIVEVKNAEGPFILVFSDAFHPEWKAYVRNDTGVGWIEALSAESEKHFTANGWSNGFTIEHCEESCMITLYFRPQSYYYLGSIISLITLLACIAYLSYTPLLQVYSRYTSKPKKEYHPPTVSDMFTDSILELHKKGKISEKEAKKYLQKAYSKKDVDYLLSHNK